MQAAASGSRLQVAAACLILAVAVLLVYARVLSHDFISSDDPIYVAKNPRVLSGLSLENIRWAFTEYHAGLYLPLTWISFMLDVELFGAVAGRMAMVNAGIHALNAILILLLLRRMTGSFWRSALVAGLFALHPLRVESVAWVTERKDVLSTMFFLLTLHAWLAFLDGRKASKYLLSILLFVCALLAKPMVVTLPFVLLLLDYWPLQRLTPRDLSPLRRLLIEKLPFFLLIAPAAFVTIQAQERALASLERLTLAHRIGNAFVSYAFYLGKTFLPSGLSAFYQHADHSAVAVSLAAFLFAAITAAAIWKLRQLPFLAVGWAWFAGTLVPVIGLVQVGSQARADRFTYIPAIGLSIAIVWLLGGILSTGKLRRAGVYTGIAGCVVLSVLAWRQAGHWKSSLTLYQHAVAVTQNNAGAHAGLAGALMGENDREGARREYETALRLNPGLGIAHYGIGLLERGDGDLPAAERSLRAALAANPHIHAARVELGHVELAQGKVDAARKTFQDVVARDPSNAEARASLLFLDDDVTSAIPAYEEALRFQPADASLRNNLAAALAKAGRDREALEQYRAALEIDPSLYDAHMNVGALLSRMENAAESRRHFEQASKLRPSSPEPLVYLALIDAGSGRFGAAAESMQRAIRADETTANRVLTNAIRIAPSATNARDYLAWLESRR